MLNIWDLSTRLYHWLQAFLFFALISTAYFGLSGASIGLENVDAKKLHTGLGTVLTVLIIWRLGWGLFGSETSRFTQFVPSPSTLWAYLRGRAQNTVGHNPLGALMVIAFIILLTLQSSLGMLMSHWLDGKALFGRSLMRSLKDLHEINALLLISLSSLHILAAIITSLKGQHLIRAMFTGRIKMAIAQPQPKMARHVKSLSCLLCSALILALIILIASPKT